MVIEFTPTTLGEVVSSGGGAIQTGPFGSQLHASDYVAEGVPVIMPVNISDNRVDVQNIARITEEDANRLSRHIVRSGDIIYSRRGDVTRKALITEAEDGMFCGTGCLLVRPGSEIDPRFLTYHLGSPINQEWIIRHAIGATMPNLNTGILADAPLRVPRREVQESIAHILGSLDNKIELNRQMNATLESMAQALFKSWFVDFDPVVDSALEAGNHIPEPLQARAERRKALGDKRKPLPEHIQSQLPSSFVFSEEMGWVPVGWDIGPASDFASLNPETITKKTAPNTVEYVDLSNTNRGRIEATTTYPFSDAPSRARRILRPHDSIVGTVRPGNRAFAYINQDGLTASTGFAVLRPQESYWRSYLYLHLTRDETIDKLAHLADGAAYPAVRPEVVAQQLSVRPAEKEILEYFEEISGPIMTRIAASESESSVLAGVRDTLLPKLLSGQLAAPSTDEYLAEAI